MGPIYFLENSYRVLFAWKFLERLGVDGVFLVECLCAVAIDLLAMPARH